MHKDEALIKKYWPNHIENYAPMAYFKLIENVRYGVFRNICVYEEDN